MCAQIGYTRGRLLVPYLDKVMPKARYRFIVLANSARDGGWVRLFSQFTKSEDAEEATRLFMPLIRHSGDIVDIKVTRTIVFHP